MTILRTKRMGRAVGVVVVALLLMITATNPTVGKSHRAAPAAQAAGSTAIVPFQIQVPDAVLADLKDRLAKVRYPAEIDGSGWRYGADLAYMKELVAYWRDRYDWRAQERRLNQFEQFKTNIDGLDIHFIHRRSRLPDAVPIIIVHGWPGSFVEFHKVIEPLTDPVRFGGRPEDAFDVVVPSLPGYGFSDQPREPGYNPPAMAAMFVKLMARLGYTRYIAQGGDWGGPITAAMAVIDPTHAMGLHSNQCSAGPPAGAADPFEGVPAFEIAKMRERETFWTEQQRGYSIIQGTRPQTLGFALNDSPAGLAAWIIDKFHAWSDVDGGHRIEVHEGRAAHQCDGLLGDGDAHLRCAPLLRAAEQGRMGIFAVRFPRPHPQCAHRDPDRVPRFSEGDSIHAAEVARGSLQSQALRPGAPRRPLRGDGRTRTLRPGSPRLPADHPIRIAVPDTVTPDGSDVY